VGEGGFSSPFSPSKKSGDMVMSDNQRKNDLDIKGGLRYKVCDLCDGKGKIELDDTNIFRARMCTCPICRGRGKVKRHASQHKRRFFKCHFKRPRLKLARQGGRRLRTPSPHVWGFGWFEEKVVPFFESIYGVPYFDIEQDVPKADFEEESYLESVLELNEAISITISPDLGLPDLTLDERNGVSNLDDAIYLSSPNLLTIYGLYSDEYRELLQHYLFGPIPPLIMQSPEGYSAYGISSLSMEIGEPETLESSPSLMVTPDSNVAPQVTIQGPDAQAMGPSFTSVVQPRISDSPNPLDISGFHDPVGFNLNTNIVGPSF
jgi:hypothetical protein